MEEKNIFKQSKGRKKYDKKLKIENLALPAHHKKSHLEVEEISLASGMKIFMLPTEDIPTVSAKLAFRGGARMETPDKMGLSELMSRVWFSGTKGRSEERFLAETEDLALGISAFTGKNTFGFSLEYLTGFEKKSLELAIEAITKPLLSEPVIQREKEILFQQNKAKVDHPSYLCSRQFHKAMFGNHPLAYESLGTIDTLTSLHQSDLLGLKNQILSPNYLIMTVLAQYYK